VLSAAAKNIRMWFVKVRKIKAIYHTLNLFNLDVTTKCLIAECWIPTADVSAIQVSILFNFISAVKFLQTNLPITKALKICSFYLPRTLNSVLFRCFCSTNFFC
jgi:hypothetical protein